MLNLKNQKVMKNFIYIIAITMFTLTACVQDPWSDVEDSSWNNERSVIEVTFENQIGGAEISRIDESTGEIEVTINVSALPDLSNVVLGEIELSYGAKSSINIGEGINFENENQSGSITVTSPTGKSRTYTILVESFEETIIGAYSISNLIVYGGTGPEWGGGGVLPMTDKPWAWPETGGPAAELDNTLTLTFEGIDDDGNTFGKIENNAGADGMYADFQYVLDPNTDVNHFYRTIPKGEGTWLRNYALGTVTFTFEDGSTQTGAFIEAATTEDLGNGLSKTTDGHAFSFDLAGTDDWDNIYSDYDKFVKKPRKFWVDLIKQ